ncbi:MAG: NAD(P)H-binding protein [Chloroflexi bacterium]|nr:NAD(P)H-binding protein [Chloroflexota bacterium]
MSHSKINAVTGAFGYTGKYITRRLLAKGEQVITLTGNPKRPNPFAGQVTAYPFDFDAPEQLTETLRGVDTLYNTYWVRFDHGDRTHSRAVANTRILLRAAKDASVRRIVHVSITNPTLDSPLPYFRGKAQLEQAVGQSGLSHAILRPTVIFGREDILINNIAYLLRRFPIFAVPGDGSYRLQPIYVEDMAALAVEAGGREDNFTWDAVGPEIYTFDELVRRIRVAAGSRSRIIHLPPGLTLTLSRLIGMAVKDLVLTRDELRGLMAGLLVSAEAPRGQQSLGVWLDENQKTLGARYASEMARHYKS